MAYHQQALMVRAAAALHNFLHIHESINNLEDHEEYNIEGHPFFAVAAGENYDVPVITADNTEKAWAYTHWDHIAQAMWEHYLLDHPNLQ